MAKKNYSTRGNARRVPSSGINTSVMHAKKGVTSTTKLLIPESEMQPAAAKKMEETARLQCLLWVKKLKNGKKNQFQ